MEIIKLDLRRAVRAIKEGKILVCPTDTVYGLICDAQNKKAVARLFKIKKRPRSKPIPIFVSDIKMAKRFAKINKEQERFLKKVWPGAVTVIFKTKNGEETIGIRIPNHGFVLDLVKHTGPLAETSANISGKPASGNIKEVLKQFTLSRVEGPDLAIGAGDLKQNIASTVIDFIGKKIKILREGRVKFK